jgi:hypothetical protein
MSNSGHKNQCNVKYIHLSSIDPTAFHVAKDYEMHTKTIEHSSYEEMHEEVISGCPRGYVCREPLALFHQVLWSRGIRVVGCAGEHESVRLERDELRHAIEEKEYDLLWGPGKGGDKLLSICVDVDNILLDVDRDIINDDLPILMSRLPSSRVAKSSG